MGAAVTDLMGSGTRVDPETGHSIFSLIPVTRLRTRWHGGGEDLAVDLGLDAPPADQAAATQAPLTSVPRDQVAVGAEGSVLEQDFPNVIALLGRVWGLPAATPAFRALILDRQGRVRHWPATAWDELVFLRGLHARACADLPVADATGLVDPERYPVLEVRYRHVVERLLGAWGDPAAFRVVIEDLLIDRRGGRTGWPAEVWAELVLLQQVHDRAHGHALDADVAAAAPIGSGGTGDCAHSACRSTASGGRTSTP